MHRFQAEKKGFTAQAPHAAALNRAVLTVLQLEFLVWQLLPVVGYELLKLWQFEFVLYS